MRLCACGVAWVKVYAYMWGLLENGCVYVCVGCVWTVCVCVWCVCVCACVCVCVCVCVCLCVLVCACVYVSAGSMREHTRWL